MSPLGWKIDYARTVQAHAIKRFVDKRSKVDTNGHDHLKGKDVEPFRRRIFERSDGRCEAIIGKEYVGDGYTLTEYCCNPITWDTFEMHHDPDGYERYDSMESCFAFCRYCHKAQHPQVRLRTIPGV